MEPDNIDHAPDAEIEMAADNTHDTQAGWTPDALLTGPFYGDAAAGTPSFDAPLNALGSGCVMSFMLGRR
jgi:hypothetical protein